MGLERKEAKAKAKQSKAKQSKTGTHFILRYEHYIFI